MLEKRSDLVVYEDFVKQLADMSKLDEIKVVVDKSDAMIVFAKKARDRELLGKAIEYRWIAARRWGELYTPDAKAKGTKGNLIGVKPGGSKGRGKGTYAGGALTEPPAQTIPTLKSMGITKHQSVQYQNLAKLSKTDFKDYVERTKFSAIRELEVAKAAARATAGRARTERRERAGQVKPAIDGMDYRVGDCREVLADISSDSVAMIVTDPPYADEADPLYEWLAKFAARVLIPGGSLICYTGHHRLPRDHVIFGKHLRWWWPLVMLHDQNLRFPGKFVIPEHKPVLWYVKDHRRNKNMIADVLRTSGRDKDLHDWGQSDGGIKPLVQQLTEEGELIVDPFAGTGRWGEICCGLGRLWIGADVKQGGSNRVVL